jgi:hypothetical protein
MKVFVSYSRHNETAVTGLAGDLESAGQQVWFDKDLHGGTAWWMTILEQIRACTVFVFALSDKSLASKPCQAELRYAQDLKIPILPVVIGEVTSYRDDPIFSMQLIDYRDSSRASGLALMSALHDRASQRGDLPDPLPTPPPIPYEYLQRIGGMIRRAEEISPMEQARIVLDLRTSLTDEDDETVREDVRKLLGGLRNRSDVTYTTASDIDTLLGEHTPQPASAPVPAAPAPPPPIAPMVGPVNWQPAPMPRPQGMSSRAKLVIAGVAAAFVVVVAVLVAVFAWPKSGGQDTIASDDTTTSTIPRTTTTTTVTSIPASAADQAFLNVIKKRGITFPSEEYAIKTAKQVCQLLDNGEAPLDIANTISKNGSLSSEDAQYFVGASVGAYCPKYMDQLG